MVRKMGFIPFVRTNVPQGCKSIETNNNIFGYCLNPWNITHSCGGSSGG
jgi:Asp-tRNA(Asn)/Glu-tRNA(Gln) amidotransferase A subunit family amidase